jgi:hypothetical protein
VKVKLCLCLTKYHAMKIYPKHYLIETYEGQEVQFQAFLTSALDERE